MLILLPELLQLLLHIHDPVLQPRFFLLQLLDLSLYIQIRHILSELTTFCIMAGIIITFSIFATF